MSEIAAPSALPALSDAYRSCFEHEGGDLPGRLAAQAYLDGSTAVYHGEVIGLGFIPKLYDMDALRFLDAQATVAYRILEKVTRRFLDDAAYRRLFGFSPLLEHLICLPTGYDALIPVMRMDVFLDEGTLDFMLCEFNTDGTSAMNEDREGANALMRSVAFVRAQGEGGLALEAQELFEGWVDEFLALYGSSVRADGGAAPAASGAAASAGPDGPCVAIVDYASSATSYEFEEFRSRFEARGLRCLVCDVSSLVYEDGALHGTDVVPSRRQTGAADGACGASRIDAVYRRAVTGELLAELEGQGVRPQDVGSPGAARGALALARAVGDRSICMIGGFRTQVAHCKQLFAVLHLPETSAFLTDEEACFVRRHVPYTARLDDPSVDLGPLRSDKDAWILKPNEGYASQGVHAGIDHSQAEWEDAIEACSVRPYVVQAFCRQYATPNTRLVPLGPDGGRLARFDALALEPWNNLTGLYLYKGRFSGIFVRAGQKGIIAGFAGGITVPAFLSAYDPAAGLALRTRPGSSRKDLDD
ncbi:MAG: hypothetical protein LBL86_11965 [Coriobacteriales bacterium]|jgi:hypothetical protein|nr:hypothetical protein [Coriobacteriales bacterium]